MNTAAASDLRSMLKCYGESGFVCIGLLELILCKQSEGFEGGWQKSDGWR